MSKLWEAIKDLERERSGVADATAARAAQALATYLDEIRQRVRNRRAARRELEAYVRR